MPFLGAHPSLLRALIDRGITEPTPVQRAILEVGNPAADLMVSAQTGSGKTVAFGLAIAPTILGDDERFPPREREASPKGDKSSPRSSLALVVTPTRELAMQVAKELTWLYAPTGATFATCVGGMDIKREHHQLARSPHVVVGTPGRLCDHIERGALALDQLRVVVLDEADEMLDMGFRDELERILEATPPTRRSLLFSATIPPGIAALAKRYQKGATRIAIAGASEAHADIEQRAIVTRPTDRLAATINLLRFHAARSALVFCATRDGVQELARQLSDHGFSVVALSGELSQRERSSALAQVRDGRARVLVATDVAARGLDLPDLDLVIHADLPQNHDMLIHRSGRTGRAGRKGTSVLLVPPARRGFVERILTKRGASIAWSSPPALDEIAARDLERLDADIMTELAELTDRDRHLGSGLAARVPAQDLAALVIRTRLTAAPTPLPIVPIADERSASPRRDPQRDGAPRPQRTTAHDERTAKRETPPREPRRSHGPPAPGFVSFRINVGRKSNADPKWLIPVLCRRGKIDKSAIGKIRILHAETHVEIANDAAVAFAVAAALPDPRDRKIEITALT